MSKYKARRNDFNQNNDRINTSKKNNQKYKRNNQSQNNYTNDVILPGSMPDQLSQVKKNHHIPIMEKQREKMEDKAWNKQVNKLNKQIEKNPQQAEKVLNKQGVNDYLNGKSNSKKVKKSNVIDDNGDIDVKNLNKSIKNEKRKDNVKKIGKAIIKWRTRKLRRRILIIGIIVSLFLLLLTFTTYAMKDLRNLDLTNNTSMTSKSNTLSKDISNRIVNLDLNNLIINNDTSNPIYVINITSGFNIDDVKNLISEFVDNNNIEDYFIINSSSDITDDELYIIYNNRLVDKNNLNDSIIATGLVKLSYSGGTLGALEELANWYISNVYTYQGNVSGKGTGSRKMYENPFFQEKIGDDCSAFASAYMSLASNNYLGISSSSEMISLTGSWAQKVSAYGWKAYSSDNVGNLIPGDVLVSSANGIVNGQGHVEIYVNETSTFGWGSIKKTYPTNNSVISSTRNGHNVFLDGYANSKHVYTTIYRYEG